MATHTGSAAVLDPVTDMVSLASGARGSDATAEIFSQRMGSAAIPADPIASLLQLPQHGGSALTGFRRSPGDPGYGGLPLSTLFGSMLKTVGLEWLRYEPGSYYLDDFGVMNPTTGTAQNADTTPPIAIYRMNGATGIVAISGAMTPSVVAVDVGRYVVTGQLPAAGTWNAKDVIGVRAQVTVGGKIQKIPVSTFRVQGIPAEGLCWPADIVTGGYQPGDYYFDHFAVIRPDTGQSTDADVLPVALVYRVNGVTGAAGISGDMTVTITETDGGYYLCTGQIPATWQGGDVVDVSLQILIAGKTQKLPVSSFVLSGRPLAGLSWP